MRCVVVAPSKLERPPGDRVKTDRRDAERLARLLRIGELPGAREAEEAARDLVRAREDVRGDLMRARHRLSKLLLRQGLLYDGTAWTGAHEAWLRSLSFDRLGVQLAFDEAHDTVLTTTARRTRLDTAITEMAATAPFAPIVGRLGCLRGVGTLTAFGLATEISDWHRFTGCSIGAYLGLVPGESSSGKQRSQGSITRSGPMCGGSPADSGRDGARPWAAVDECSRVRQPGVRGEGHAWRSRTRQGLWRPVVCPAFRRIAVSMPRWHQQSDPRPHAEMPGNCSIISANWWGRETWGK